MSDQPAGSAIARIRLGARLRRLREARGVTAQQAAAAIGGSDSKISRIELGRHAAREIDVVDLLTLYQVTDSGQREELLDLASQALAAPWWQHSADLLPPWFQTYLGLEEAAAGILSYDTHAIPGLLQTPDYCAGLLGAADFDAEETRRMVEVQARRIERFAARGWRLRAVIDEAVLLRPVTGHQVHAGQLRHLREAAAWPGVTVRIRPLAAGAAAAPAGFTIVQMADPDLPDVVYTEQLTAASYLDRPADVRRYVRAFGQLEGSSQPATRTGAVIDKLLADLDRSAC